MLKKIFIIMMSLSFVFANSGGAIESRNETIELGSHVGSNQCAPLERKLDRRTQALNDLIVFYPEGHPDVTSLTFEVAGLFNALIDCWGEYPIP